MTQLYKVEVFDTAIHSHGISTILLRGQPLTVEGMPMVKLHHGTIVEAGGWHADERDARCAAAERIEELGRKLLAQADSIREGAVV